MTDTVRVSLPVYPGWRMWLWQYLRINRPLWNVYELEIDGLTDKIMNSPDGVVEATINGGGLIRRHVRHP